MLFSRREFCKGQVIAASGAGFGALALQSMLERDRRIYADDKLGIASPMAPKAPMLKAQAKSVIFLFMFGGPSQLDLFDYKPELQKRDGQEIDNEFRKGTKTKAVLQASRRVFRQHGESGLWCSDAFPKIGRAHV